jgi:hypothetical protein
MEGMKTIEQDLLMSDFVSSALAMIDKVTKPKNKIIERLKAQVQCSSLNEPAAGYSRMHSRHNRS